MVFFFQTELSNKLEVVEHALAEGASPGSRFVHVFLLLPSRICREIYVKTALPLTLFLI
jgi:hypothetical protein